VRKAKRKRKKKRKAAETDEFDKLAERFRKKISKQSMYIH